MQVLDRVRFGFGPSARSRAVYSSNIAQVARRNLLLVPDEVTGYILHYWLLWNLTSELKNWGYSKAVLGQVFKVRVDCMYQAADERHTRIDLKVWRPDGSIFTANDDDLWPYQGPGEYIEFCIAGALGSWFIINQGGVWEAELTYVAV